ALMEVLAVVLLTVRNDRLCLAELVEHDDQLAALDLLNFSREEIAHPARELVADLGSLALAHALDDALLRRLNRRSSEFSEVDGNLHLVADLKVGILKAGFLERDLTGRVGHLFDNRLKEHDANRT